MKYLKLFEDWTTSGSNSSKEVLEDIIIDFILKDKFEYEIMNDIIDDFNVCEAIACYIYDYNEDTPYIHYLSSLLRKHNYKPSVSFTYNADDLGEYEKKIYDEFVNTNIYEKVLNSKESFNILNYLKFNYLDFYKEFNKYSDGIDISAELGASGHSD